jgi:uncharacterized membrane protein
MCALSLSEIVVLINVYLYSHFVDIVWVLTDVFHGGGVEIHVGPVERQHRRRKDVSRRNL